MGINHEQFIRSIWWKQEANRYRNHYGDWNLYALCRQRPLHHPQARRRWRWWWWFVWVWAVGRERWRVG